MMSGSQTAQRNSAQSGQSGSNQQGWQGDATNLTPFVVHSQNLKSIQLPDGSWHDVEDCYLVPFAIGNGQSPSNPTQLFNALNVTYTSSGIKATVPLRHIVGFSREKAEDKSTGTYRQNV